MLINKLFSVKNKTVVITGCGTGIGFELAKGFILNEANVIGISRRRPKENLNFSSFFECDITIQNEIKKLANQMRLDNIAIDVLLNVAGVSIVKSSKFDEMSRFDKTLDTNLRAMYNLILELKSQYISGSSIINFSSIAGHFGFPNNPSYCASKGGVLSLSKALSYDLGSQNIRVNCIMPGYFHTKMTAASFSDEKEKKMREDRTFLGRWGGLSELLGASIFLASDASSYVTGTELIVDGGWSAKGL